MNKKILLIFPLLMAGVVASAQHLETTIKDVNGKAHIAIKAVGGNISGYASNYVMVVAIPKVVADAGITLKNPAKLDASRVSANAPSTLPSYSDGVYKYFLLFYTGTSSDATIPPFFEGGIEYDIFELTWSGPDKSFPVSLISLPAGGAGNAVAPSQWQQYLEIGGREVSIPTNYFYQSSTSTIPIQATDYATGMAIVTTRSTITTSGASTVQNPAVFNTLAIGGLFPNPARDKINVIINTPQRDNVTLVVTDILGKIVKQQLVNVETGSNTVPVDIAKLAQGSYMVKVICKTSDCEIATGKFNKQ